MPERNPEVLAFVRQQLQDNPELGSRELYERAQAVEPSIAELAPRQFHGRYFLAAKRELAPAPQATGSAPRKRARPSRRAEQPRPGRRRSAAAAPAPAAGREREQVRAVFLRFARDLAAAESRSELVQVLSGIDQYVDDVLRTAPA